AAAVAPDGPVRLRRVRHQREGVAGPRPGTRAGRLRGRDQEALHGRGAVGPVPAQPPERVVRGLRGRPREPGTATL
ncbi:MAG: hypothetical protein AVDCRST_MAG90-2225, partial [uncultured Microvirga sp.]